MPVLSPFRSDFRERERDLCLSGHIKCSRFLLDGFSTTQLAILCSLFSQNGRWSIVTKEKKTCFRSKKLNNKVKAREHERFQLFSNETNSTREMFYVRGWKERPLKNSRDRRLFFIYAGYRKPVLLKILPGLYLSPEKIYIRWIFHSSGT